MRLSERKVCFPQCDKQGNLTKVDYIEIKDKKLAEQKLCQLEDIEEELGIDLITLFKALKNGIWSKGGYYGSCCIKNEPHFIKPENIRLGKTWYDEVENEDDYKYLIDENNQLCLFEMEYEDEQYVVRAKDYGRTWALTKEELL